MNNSSKDWVVPSDQRPPKPDLGGTVHLPFVARSTNRRSNIPDASDWPQVDVLSVPEAKQALFRVRREAVTLYLLGTKIKDICRLTGISRTSLNRMVVRCLSIDEHGGIFGFKALVPGVRVKKYTRKAPVQLSLGDHRGGAGAFMALLDQYPELKQLIYLGLFPPPGKKHIRPRRLSLIAIHSNFLKQCRLYGLEERFEYPFNTSCRGYNSLCHYANQLKLKNAKQYAANRSHDSNAEKKLRSGDGADRPAFNVMERVECDAHHIDAIFCVLIPNSYGGFIAKVIDRLWLLVILDVRTRAVLGWHLSLRKECNEADLIQTIKFALTKWKKRALLVPRMSYDEGAGFPSAINDKYAGACWQEFSVDGAKINLSERTKDVLREVVGGQPPFNYPRRIPDDRPYIERFFRTLEDSSFHSMPNTVGSGPDDAIRKSPEMSAVRYFIQYEYLQDIIDIVLSGYNATPHSSLGGRSPLQYFDYLVKSTQTKLRVAEPERVRRIHAHKVFVKVRGNIEEGRRPFVEHVGAKYTSDYLRNAFDLIGKTIAIDLDELDPRVAMAYGPNGHELGPLRAGPPWNLLPHTLEIRRAYMAAVRAGKIDSRSNNAVVALLTYLEDRARKGEGVPNLYLQLREIITSNPDIIRQEYGEEAKSVAVPKVAAHASMPMGNRLSAESQFDRSSAPRPRRAKIGNLS